MNTVLSVSQYSGSVTFWIWILGFKPLTNEFGRDPALIVNYLQDAKKVFLLITF